MAHLASLSDRTVCFFDKSDYCKTPVIPQPGYSPPGAVLDYEVLPVSACIMPFDAITTLLLYCVMNWRIGYNDGGTPLVALSSCPAARMLIGRTTAVL